MKPRTDNNFWTRQWENIPFRLVNLNSDFDIEIFKLFCRMKDLLNDTHNVNILEVGCGGSVWLPFLRKTFGWEITGFDYNSLGVKKAKMLLKKMNVEGLILKRNLFDDNKDLINKFDIVYSGGFIEHFDNFEKVILILKKFVKRDGYILTTIPNLFNYSNFIEKIVGKKNLSAHNYINMEELVNGHKINGFQMIDCRYVGFGGIMVSDSNNILSRSVIFVADKCYRGIKKILLLLKLKPPIGKRTATIIAYIGKSS